MTERAAQRGKRQSGRGASAPSPSQSRSSSASALESGAARTLLRAGPVAEVGRWLDGFRWHHFATFAPTREATADELCRAFDTLIANIEAKIAKETHARRPIAWFRCIEGGEPARAGKPYVRRHMHALLYGTSPLAIRQIRKLWVLGKQFDLRTFDPGRGAAYYVAKTLGGASSSERWEVSAAMPPSRSESLDDLREVAATGNCSPPSPDAEAMLSLVRRTPQIAVDLAQPSPTALAVERIESAEPLDAERALGLIVQLVLRDCGITRRGAAA